MHHSILRSFVDSTRASIVPKRSVEPRPKARTVALRIDEAVAPAVKALASLVLDQARLMVVDSAWHDRLTAAQKAHPLEVVLLGLEEREVRESMGGATAGCYVASFVRLRATAATVSQDFLMRLDVGRGALVSAEDEDLP